MKDEQILKTLRNIIEYIDIAPSSFAEEYGFNEEEIGDIVLDKQVDTIVKILKEKCNGYKFTAQNVRRLIKKSNDEQNVLYLVAATKNAEFIKYYVRKTKLRTDYKVDLAIFLGDKEFIQECIEKKEFTTSSKVRLIKAMGSEYIKQYLSDISKDYIALYQKIELIIATEDSEYIQNFIKKSRESIEDEKLIRLILATKDEKYIDKCIKDSRIELADKLILIKELAKRKNNSQIIYQYMKELENQLDERAKKVLTIIINDIEHKEYTETKKTNKKNKITIPPQMTVGIEIESIGKYAEALQNVQIGKWTGKKDASLSDYESRGYCGLEVVSPILKNDGQMERSIENICSLLKESGQKIKEICGGHIHIGADYLTTTDSMVNFLYLLENSEDFLYIMANEEGEIPRKATMYYAEPFTSKLDKSLKRKRIKLDVDMDFEKFRKEVGKIQNKNRYIGVNFYNLSNKRNTIEFRMPNGTLNAKQWIENINLFGGLVKAAEDIMVIQSKNETERTIEENKKLQLFYILPKLNDEERLNAILKLAIEGDKTPYITRYNINRELINLYGDKSFDNQFVLKKGMIKPRDIGRFVFTGKDAVTTEELVQAEKEINSILQLEKSQEI
ncbi:MAG: amidoligase family protein [Clostridia bacterium]|nr:amidoligase family protein [Clostridia bacterium]